MKYIENFKKLPQKSGIYMIKNKINNHVYIGQSTNIYKRFNSHHKRDSFNKKYGYYNTKLSKAIRKYGWNNFDVYILEECTQSELNKREIYWINYYNSYRKGYNSTPGGNNFSEKVFSKKTNKKRRKTLEINGKLKNDKHPRAKISNDEVIEIRQRYIDGEEIQDIYKDYEYIYSSVDCLKNIIFGRSYKTVGNIPRKEEIRYTNKGKNTGKIPLDIIKSIRKDRENKELTYSELANKYGLSIATIGKIINRQLYKNT